MINAHLVELLTPLPPHAPSIPNRSLLCSWHDAGRQRRVRALPRQHHQPRRRLQHCRVRGLPRWHDLRRQQDALLPADVPRRHHPQQQHVRLVRRKQHQPRRRRADGGVLALPRPHRGRRRQGGVCCAGPAERDSHGLCPDHRRRRQRDAALGLHCGDWGDHADRWAARFGWLACDCSLSPTHPSLA